MSGSPSKPIIAPQPEFVCELRVEVGPMTDFGATAHGQRRYIPILGGTVSGPRLNGVIVPGGGDMQTIRADGVFDIEATYAVRADDGTMISIVNPGYRHGPPEVIARLAAGQPVDPSEYYFRTSPRFYVASDSPHAWLSRTVCIATGERQAGLVVIRCFSV